MCGMGHSWHISYAMNLALAMSTNIIMGGLNVKGIVNTKSHLGFVTIGMRRYFDVGGGQGGIVNAPRDRVNSSPKIGLSWLHDSFGSMVVMLCLSL